MSSSTRLPEKVLPQKIVNLLRSALRSLGKHSTWATRVRSEQSRFQFRGAASRRTKAD